MIQYDVWEPIEEKMIGFNLYLEVVQPCSVWHIAHTALEWGTFVILGECTLYKFIIVTTIESCFHFI